MANLNVVSQDGMYHITSQDFFLQFPDTEKNTRMLWLLLRARHAPDTGKSLFTHEQIAKAFGDTHRQNIQNFAQEFEKCGGDLLAYLLRKRKVDVSVVEAVGEGLRQHPLAPATKLLPLVLERLHRTDVTPDNIRTALRQIPCSVLRPVLQQQWERGAFHPTEAVLLQQALAILLEPSASPASSVADTLLDLGVTRWLRDHAASLPKNGVATLKRTMKRGRPDLRSTHRTTAASPCSV